MTTRLTPGARPRAAELCDGRHPPRGPKPTYTSFRTQLISSLSFTLSACFNDCNGIDGVSSMKFVPTAAFVLAAITLCPTLAAVRPQPAAAETVPIWAYAPADEYFGPLKMSILGVNNAMVNVRRRQNGGVMSDDTLSSLNQVTLSIRDCQRHYPRDPWNARAIFDLEETYGSFSDTRARRHASQTSAWLLRAYPRSRSAARLRLALARARAGERVARNR